MNDQQPQARDITIEQYCYNSQVESTSSQLFNSQNNTVKHSSDTCSPENCICQLNKNLPFMLWLLFTILQAMNRIIK